MPRRATTEQPAKKPFVYRGSHERIIKEALYLYYLLTARQITRLLYPSEKLGMFTTVKERLAQLSREKYINSYPLPTSQGQRPLAYLLGLYGERSLAALGYDITMHRKLSEWKEKSYAWQMHLLELNDFLIAAKILEKSESRLYLFDWQHDLTIKANPATALGSKGKTITVSPDGFLDIRTQAGKRACFLVELDRANNSNAKFKKKIQDIITCFDQGKLTAHFNAKKLTILFPTTAGERRVEQMRDLTRQALKELGITGEVYKTQMFHFAAVPPLTSDQPDPKTLFCSPVWTTPYGDPEEKIALFDFD